MVTVNENLTELAVTTSYNTAKGTFKITAHVTTQQVTGDAVLDGALVEQLAAQFREAIAAANVWREEQYAAAGADENGDDPAQIKIGFAPPVEF